MTFFFFLITCYSGVRGQQNYAAAYEKQADKALEQKSYWSALELYQTASKFVKKDLRLMYKIAKVNLLLLNYDEAKQGFEDVIEQKDTLNIHNTFTDFYLCLAKCAVAKGEIEDADDYIKLSLKFCPDMAVRNQLKALSSQITWITDNQDITPDTRVRLLGANINNAVSQSGGQRIDNMFIFNKTTAVQRRDAKGVYFENMHSFIDYSFVDEDFHTPSRHLDWGKINDKSAESSNLFFDSIEQTAYFVRCADESSSQGCKIYTSTRNSKGKWSNPKVMDFCSSSKASFTHPFLTRISGQKILFFASDMTGGYGEMDLWQINLTNKYSVPQNLGIVINTKGNEITPFYVSQTNTLYFSSDAHIGFGGFDIFRSKGMNTTWEKPVNMLKPINSGANDLYPVVMARGTTCYLTSNRSNPNADTAITCCNRIYMWKTDTTSKKSDTIVLDNYVKTLREGFNPAFDLPLDLYFHNDQPNPFSSSKTTDFDYSECWKQYSDMKGLYRSYYVISNDTAGEKQVTDFFSQNIDYGMDKLNAMMQYLYNNLQEGKSLDVQIRGSASALFSENYNYNLSERRINTIENYISRWKGGILAQYLRLKASDGKPQLNILHLPLGKSEAKSSNPQTLIDKRNSVYTLSAMAERKIEIKIIMERFTN
jgi:tetratricopeptide (TPR) repeat protein